MTESVLELLTERPGWSWAPFGRVTTRSQRAGQPELNPLSVFLDAGVVPRSSREDNHNRLGSDLSNYLVVEPDDLVFNKLRTWQGGFGASAHDGIVSPAYFVCKPTDMVDARFLDYLLHSSVYLAELTRVSKFMPPSQFDIAWDDLKELSLLLPRPQAQGAIADYLDAETNRVDELLCRQRDLEARLEERFRSLRRRLLLQSPVPPIMRTPLSRLVSSPVGGAWGESPGDDEVDVHCARVADFDRQSGRLDPLTTVRSIGRPQQSRLQLVTGDLLLEKSGGGDNQPVGFTVQVREVIGPTVSSNFVARLRPALSVDPTYLRHLFLALYDGQRNVPFIKQTTGIQNLDVTAFLRQPVDVPAIEHQRRMGQELDAGLDQLTSAARGLTRQIELLQERRQALITAAVTGELEIPGAA